MALTLRKPVRLRSNDESRRKVTWLELFFDLVFVAAVAQVAEPLRHHYEVGELLRFTPLFLLIWWAWTGRALFSTRFDTDDGVQRVLTLVEMFAVAVMAANAQDSLVSRDSAGFAAAYAVVRLVLLVHYLRARSVESARSLTARYMAGHGVAAALWLVSAILPPAARLFAWAVAIAIDLATPWSAVAHSARVPPNAAHLPERFGLFTLILLGESLVATMKGIESQEGWTPAAAATAFAGMALLFGVWWWYFEGIDATAERKVRSHGDALRLHLWSYLHFPLYLSIVVVGVGIQRAVSLVGHTPIPGRELALLCGAGSLLLLSGSIIGRLGAGGRGRGRAVHASGQEPMPA